MLKEEEAWLHPDIGVSKTHLRPALQRDAEILFLSLALGDPLPQSGTYVAPVLDEVVSVRQQEEGAGVRASPESPRLFGTAATATVGTVPRPPLHRHV